MSSNEITLKKPDVPLLTISARKIHWNICLYSLNHLALQWKTGQEEQIVSAGFPQPEKCRVACSALKSSLDIIWGTITFISRGKKSSESLTSAELKLTYFSRPRQPLHLGLWWKRWKESEKVLLATNMVSLVPPFCMSPF